MLPWTRWGCESLPDPVNQPIVHYLISDCGFFSLGDDYATREVDSDVICVFVFFAEDVDRHVGVDNDDDDDDIDDGGMMTRMMIMTICWR